MAVAPVSTLITMSMAVPTAETREAAESVEAATMAVPTTEAGEAAETVSTTVTSIPEVGPTIAARAPSIPAVRATEAVEAVAGGSVSPTAPTIGAGGRRPWRPIAPIRHGLDLIRVVTDLGYELFRGRRRLGVVALRQFPQRRQRGLADRDRASRAPSRSNEE